MCASQKNKAPHPGDHEAARRHSPPKFHVVFDTLNREVAPLRLCPVGGAEGGYFVSFFTMPGTRQAYPEALRRGRRHHDRCRCRLPPKGGPGGQQHPHCPPATPTVTEFAAGYGYFLLPASSWRLSKAASELKFSPEMARMPAVFLEALLCRSFRQSGMSDAVVADLGVRGFDALHSNFTIFSTVVWAMLSRPPWSGTPGGEVTITLGMAMSRTSLSS